MNNSSSGINLRQIILLLLLLGFTWLVISRFTDLRNLVTTLLQGNWYWLSLGVLLHVLYFYLDAVLHKYSFAAVGVRGKASELFQVLLSAFFVNSVAPTGGAGGFAIFVDYSVRNGRSGSKTAAGMILALISDLSTLIPFIIWGVAFLAAHNQLRTIETIGFIVFILFISLLSGVLLLAGWKPNWLRRSTSWIQRIVNQAGSRLGRSELLARGWAEKNSMDFIEGAKAITTSPKNLGITLFWGMVLHIVNVVGLYILFLAYDQPVRWGTLIAAFGLGIVFFIITVIPHGLGAVEWVMTSIFVSMGIPPTKAAVITLVFRGVNFWMPLTAGFFFLRKVTINSEGKRGFTKRRPERYPHSKKYEKEQVS